MNLLRIVFSSVVEAIQRIVVGAGASLVFLVGIAYVALAVVLAIAAVVVIGIVFSLAWLIVGSPGGREIRAPQSGEGAVSRQAGSMSG